MEVIKDTLMNHPSIGMGSSLGGSLLPFVETLNPVIQFCGMCIGLLVGVATLILKVKQLME